VVAADLSGRGSPALLGAHHPSSREAREHNERGQRGKPGFPRSKRAAARPATGFALNRRLRSPAWRHRTAADSTIPSLACIASWRARAPAERPARGGRRHRQPKTDQLPTTPSEAALPRPLGRPEPVVVVVLRLRPGPCRTVAVRRPSRPPGGRAPGRGRRAGTSDSRTARVARGERPQVGCAARRRRAGR
jgi:hypothetical protein